MKGGKRSNSDTNLPPFGTNYPPVAAGFPSFDRLPGRRGGDPRARTNCRIDCGNTSSMGCRGPLRKSAPRFGTTLGRRFRRWDRTVTPRENGIPLPHLEEASRMAAHLKPRAGVRSGPLHRFVAPPLVLLALGLLTVGCATKGYVKQRVAESEARTDASLNVVRSDLTETRTVADQAMERATLAEKLAAGAVDYTVVSTHEARFAFDDFRLDDESRTV